MNIAKNNLAVVIISVLRHFVGCEIDTTGCSSVPLKCFDPWHVPHICNTDADCRDGKLCCYKSCFKQCVPKDPCSIVMCSKGYLCQVLKTNCDGNHCEKEASCVPADEVNCPTLGLISKCPPGFERTNDTYGCPTGPCQAKHRCPGTCKIGCAYGPVLDEIGCPTCRCKPSPDHPCSEINCGRTAECRVKQTVPQILATANSLNAACIPNSMIAFSVVDLSCGLFNPTTSGMPIVDANSQEIDCSSTKCPVHSVCVGSAFGINKCCWQHSQVEITSSPKIGECPSTAMMKTGARRDRCEVDANCHGTMKCCYINKARGKQRYLGICLEPIHVILGERNLCLKLQHDPRLWFFMMLGVC